MQGNYALATDYSRKANEVSSQINEANTTLYNRVIYATAKAHKIFEEYKQEIDKNTIDSLQKILKLKSGLLEHGFYQ